MYELVGSTNDRWWTPRSRARAGLRRARARGPQAPVETSGPGDGLVPAGQVGVHGRAVRGRREPPRLAPGGGDLVLALPHAGRQAGQARGAEGRGLDDLGPRDGHAEDVALELHEQVVGRRAAVDLEHGERAPGVA